MASDIPLAGLRQEKSSASLPTPVISKPKTLSNSNIAKGAVWFICAYLAIYCFQNPYDVGSELDDNSRSGGDPNTLAYFDAVVSKGHRQALPDHHQGPLGSVAHRPTAGCCQYHADGHHGTAKPISPKAAEELFLRVPNNETCKAASRRYTAYAHPAGSGFDYVSALSLKNEWEGLLGLPMSGASENVYEAGSSESQARIRGGMGVLGAWVDTYYPVMNTPVSSSITLLSDPPFKAKLREDIVDGDPDSVLRDEVRVFHGLSASGDVKGKYVYAGYGRKADFDVLQEKGVVFTNRIVIVKYGRVFRGLKIKAAQEAGAIGCIVYSDPGDDGEITEANGYEQYPNGPARQQSSVQRGSVQFLSKYPGDPSTPGKPAYRNATRLGGTNQPSIPSLPLSYEDAIPILKALQGQGIRASVLGREWDGGLGYKGVEYWVGPSEVDLHVVNEVNTRVMPIWNTMATIPGHLTDEVVMVGNHRDAWVLGAGDPNSGTASLHELVRGLGELLKKGWKPLRTIVLASWDAEEYGLIGSTEWTEDFADWLRSQPVAYLNVDESVVGSSFTAAASPSLAWLIRTAAVQVMSASNQTRSIWDTANDGGDWASWRASVYGEEEDLEATFSSDTGIPALGSGSDFTAFLQRYGVACTVMKYGYRPKDPTYHYHSIYDSFAWQEKVMDPHWHKHVDIAKILGLAVLRVADGLVLPLNTTRYAIELGTYLAKVQHIAQSKNETSELDLEPLTKSIHKLVSASHDLDTKADALVSKLRNLLPRHDPRRPRFVTRLAHFWRSLKQGFSWKTETWTAGDAPLKPDHLPKKTVKQIRRVLEQVRMINKKRQAFEGGFISEEGIKEREWYKHKGVAPGLWLGYGATTFPALTEALTIDHSLELAQKEANELADMIGAMSERLSA